MFLSGMVYHLLSATDRFPFLNVATYPMLLPFSVDSFLKNNPFPFQNQHVTLFRIHVPASHRHPFQLKSNLPEFHRHRSLRYHLLHEFLFLSLLSGYYSLLLVSYPVLHHRTLSHLE